MKYSQYVDYIWEEVHNNCPKGYIVIWNRYDNGFRYVELDKEGYHYSFEGQKFIEINHKSFIIIKGVKYKIIK